MRPIHLLLGLAVVLTSAASAFVATRLASTQVQAQPVITADLEPKDASDEALAARATADKLAFMTAQLDALSREVEELRNAANRAPVAIPSAAGSPESAANVVVSEVQRATVLAVLADERAREAAEAKAKREADERQAAERRAARVAKELSLSPGDEARLADLMVEGGKKRQELFESMRTGNFDREVARTQFETYRSWQTDQLTQAFGAGIAEQILKSEGDRMGFGGGPGMGGDGGGGGGNNRGRRGGQTPGGTGGAGGGGTQQQ